MSATNKTGIATEVINYLAEQQKMLLIGDKTGKELGVSLPNSIEVRGNEWWISCPQGRFCLRMDKPVLYCRVDPINEQDWVSIYDSYRGERLVRNDGVNTLTPSQVSPADANWLLGFIRQCVAVWVVEGAVPTLAVENRAALQVGPRKTPPTKIMVRRRSRGRCLRK